MRAVGRDGDGDGDDDAVRLRIECHGEFGRSQHRQRQRLVPQLHGRRLGGRLDQPAVLLRRQAVPGGLSRLCLHGELDDDGRRRRAEIDPRRLRPAEREQR